jgi:hypothetical protein
MRFTQTSLLACLALLLFSTCNDPEPDKKFLTARVYNEQTVTGESNYLNTIDISKLTELQKAAITARRGEIEQMAKLLSADPNVIINIVRCLPGAPRDPPGPCPISEAAVTDFPIDTQIELDMIGAFMDVVEAENPQARILAEQGTAQLVTTDGKMVFAEGSFSAYDSLFHTAWYVFDVKKKALASKPLVLKITTQVIVNQQIKAVTIEKPIPAGTFLADKIN